MATLDPVILAASRMSTDPLPSWNDGAETPAILDFVARVTEAA